MITIKELEIAFNNFNKKYFNSTLPVVTIKYCNSKSYSGIFIPWKDKTDKYTIKITKYYNIPDFEAENILIHEMIHLWQFINGYTDIHGTSFITKMNEINAIGDHKISTTDKNKYDVSIYSKDYDKIWYIAHCNYGCETYVLKFRDLNTMFRFCKKYNSSYCKFVRMYSTKSDIVTRLRTTVKKPHMYPIIGDVTNLINSAITEYELI